MGAGSVSKTAIPVTNSGAEESSKLLYLVKTVRQLCHMPSSPIGMGACEPKPWSYAARELKVALPSCHGCQLLLYKPGRSHSLALGIYNHNLSVR
jgi:hypothetical protein